MLKGLISMSDINVQYTKAALTICALNYIDKALVLRESFLRHNPDCDFIVLLVDRKDPNVATALGIPNLLWVEDLGIPDLPRYAFMYDVIELSTNVKAFALRRLLSQYGYVLYLDPDIKVFDSLDVVFSELRDASAVVTPHSLTPILDGKNPNDVEFLRFGSFNLGFIGVAATEEAFRFLDWWAARCLLLGFYEPQSGLAVDQKWVDLAPCYFPSIKILRHPGLNVAFWNLHERAILETGGHRSVLFANTEYPLVFFHFSSFNMDDPLVVASKQNRYLKGERHDIDELLLGYKEDISRRHSSFSDRKYSYDYFSNGEYITPTLRRIFASMPRSVMDADPFLPSSRIREYGRKNGLVKGKFAPQKRETFKDMQTHPTAIRMANRGLAVALRLLGPYRYYALMRYLTYLSSIRKQGELFWKKEYKDA
jgi:hypothetical protein